MARRAHPAHAGRKRSLSRHGVAYGMRSFTQSKDWAALIATLKASGLRLGGAGFPRLKWELVRNRRA
jgi:NADH:ubiquinone oxidoreductase subunit F (NADH-binding)